MTWNRFSTWVETHRHFLLDIIRIYLGVGLLIKGVFYLQNPALVVPAGAPAWLTSVAGAAPYIHIVGGLLLAVGFLTRFAAIIQMPVVFAALMFIHVPQMSQSMQARESMEFSALTLFLLTIIALAGPGPLSLAERLNLPFDLAAASFREWARRHADLFLDAIRVYLGVGLIIKGFYFMGHNEQFSALLQDGKMPFGLMTAAHYVIPAHFVGGAMLLLGFATRLGAIAQIPLLIGALFYVYLPRFTSLELRQNIEFSALVLFLLCIIAVHGSGRYSVDYAVQKNYRDHHPEAVPAHS